MPTFANLTFRAAALAACLLACLPAAFCQKKSFADFNPRFEAFTLPGGVLGNSIQSIVQDSAGFLWFGSQEGLHRYDGTGIFTYRHEPDNPNSIASDYIESIFLDSKGVLWLAHWNNGGLTVFDPATEKFTRYFQDPGDPASLSGNTISIIAEDRQGYVWAGGQAGLNRFDRKTGKFKHFRHDPNDPRSLSYDQVRALYVDKKGTLWVGTGFPWDTTNPAQRRGGLNRFDPKSETFTRFLHDPNNMQSLAHNVVRGLLEDSRGNFWVGTGGDGLQLMNREKGTFTRLPYDPNPDSYRDAKLSRPWLKGTSPAAQPADAHVTSLLEDRDGRIWITAIFGGLNVFQPDAASTNPASGTVRHFENLRGEGNLTNNFLWQVFQSADGVVWIATAGGGGTVFKVSNEGFRFPFFLPDSSASGPGSVSDVVKDKAGNVWVSYFDEPALPLLRHDRKTGKTVRFPSGDNTPGGLNARRIHTLCPDRESSSRELGGYLWVGTENGLFRYESGGSGQTGTFRHFPNPLSQNTLVSYILQDSKGYVWAFSWGIGLNRLDPKTGKYTAYRRDPNDPSSIGGRDVGGLYEDVRGNFWVSGGSQNDIASPLFLDRFHPEKTDADGRVAFTHFIKEKLPGTADYLTGDDDGNLWFLDGQGSLQKLNPATGILQRFTPANSNLPSRSLTAMAKAKNGKFWLNGSGGFICEFDPKTEQFTTYGNRHGIETGAREISEVFVADDGEVFIGRRGGYVAFYPDSIRREENSRPPLVRITDFRLFDERVVPGSTTEKYRGVLQKPIWQTSNLRLAHDQNIFSFSVSCFDFSDPGGNQLQFMLEGYDKGWRNDLRNGETPSYVNVQPGGYTFQVRGANSLGAWNMEGVSLKIKILPPWWKTPWAYTIYGLLFLAGAILFDRNQRRRIIQKERHRILQRELEQAKEIEKAYAELKATQAQLIQSEKLASLGELTAGIAHEIQNPLNFVNNFAELSVDLAKELNEELEKDSIDKGFVMELMGDLTSNQQKINHHGKRAASIVTGMLQHARTSTGKKEPTDLNALADEYLRLSYHGLRAKDSSFNAQMVTDFDPAVGMVEVIPQDIGRVFLNLLNNAFYATQQRKLEIGKLEIGKSKIHESKLGVPFEPTVSVSSKRTENGVEFRIKDNGTGIPDSVKARIFQPFFTTKPTGQGTGLGLSLAYDIVVKGHGGTLEVNSTEGVGSEFTITLPVKPVILEVLNLKKNSI